MSFVYSFRIILLAKVVCISEQHEFCAERRTEQFTVVLFRSTALSRPNYY